MKGKIIGLCLVVLLSIGMVSADFYDANLDTSASFYNITISGCRRPIFDVNGGLIYLLCRDSITGNHNITAINLDNDGSYEVITNTDIGIPLGSPSIQGYNNHFYIAGHHSVQSDYFIAKYDLNGNEIWKINKTPMIGFNNQTGNLPVWYTQTEYTWDAQSLQKIQYTNWMGNIYEADDTGIIVCGSEQACKFDCININHNGDVIQRTTRWSPTGSCSGGDGGEFDQLIGVESGKYWVRDNNLYYAGYERNTGYYWGGNYVGAYPKVECNLEYLHNPRDSTRCKHDGDMGLFTTSAVQNNASWSIGVETDSTGDMGTSWYATVYGDRLYTSSGVFDDENFKQQFVNVDIVGNLEHNHLNRVVTRNDTNITIYDTNYNLQTFLNNDVDADCTTTDYRYKPVLTKDYIIEVQEDTFYVYNMSGTELLSYNLPATPNNCYWPASFIKDEVENEDIMFFLDNKKLVNTDAIIYWMGDEYLAPSEANESNITTLRKRGYVIDEVTGEGVPYAQINYCKWCFIEEKCIKTYDIQADFYGYFDATIESGFYNITISSIANTHGYTYGEDEYYYDNWENYTLAPYYVNASVYSGYNLSKPISNATIRFTRFGTEYQNTTNESGTAWIDLSYQGDYQYQITAEGYVPKTGALNYRDTCSWYYFDSTFTCDKPNYYLFLEDTINLTASFLVRDHLSLEPIEYAVVFVWDLGAEGVSCIEADDYAPTYSTETNVNGMAYFNLTNGTYRVDVYADDYRPGIGDESCFNFVGDAYEILNMVADPGSFPSYTLNGTTYINNEATATEIYLTSSNHENELYNYNRTITSNGSGYYEASGIYRDTILEIYIHCDPNDVFDDWCGYSYLIIDENTTFDINITDRQPYSVYVGDYSQGQRILGSAVYLYECNSTWGGCTLIDQAYDNDPNSLIQWFLEDGHNYSIKAVKTGYLEGYNNFTADSTDGYLSHIRVIPLNRIGDSCYVTFYFKSDKPLGNASYDSTIDIKYFLTQSNNTDEIMVSADIPDVNDNSLFMGLPFREHNIPCGESRYIKGEGWGNVITDEDWLTGTNYGYLKVYNIDLLFVTADERYKDYIVILKRDLSVGDVYTSPGGTVETPMSEDTNIFSQIIIALMEGFGFNVDGFSLLGLIVWLAYMTIVVTFIGGIVRVVQWVR